MKVLMLLDNPYNGDPRVQKEVHTLSKEGHEIQLFCLIDKSLEKSGSKPNLSIHRMISTDIFDVKKPTYFGEISSQIKNLVEKVDIIHCHDHVMLHLGVVLKDSYPGCKLIYDSHELFYSFPLLNISGKKHPFLYLKSWIVRLILKKREHRDILKADKVITINHSIGKLLQQHHGLKAMPTVVRNVPLTSRVKKDKSYFRNKYNIKETTSVLIFISGKIHPRGHNLETVIDSIGDSEDFALIITGSGKGRQLLEEYVSESNISNVFFHDPVAPGEIIGHLSQADYGLLPFWNKTDLSYWYALPNKLFEYLMAGLPVLSTTQPEYKRIIEQYNVGVAINPEVDGAFLRGMKDLLSNKQYFKQNVEKAVKVLNWNQEEKILLDLYNNLDN